MLSTAPAVGAGGSSTKGTTTTPWETVDKRSLEGSWVVEGGKKVWKSGGQGGVYHVGYERDVLDL
jgi:hypothetical protein